jgi:isorenieratene synthase
LYDYPDDDYSLTLLGPLLRHLEKHGAEILMDKPVASLRPAGKGYQLGKRKFDYVVLASDVKGTRAIAERSKALASKYPDLVGKLRDLRSSNRYAVLRIWADRDVGQGIPGFVITDHDRVLDSISFYHRLEKSSAEWVKQHGGGIYELHSYAVPDEVGSNQEIRDRFLSEFADYFPETRSMRILDEHLQVRDDFTAFHTGMYAGRPEVETEAKGLFLAGDWVKLPRPAMLMEAACMSGILAANGILRAEGLREEEVFSVPPRGVLARR